MSRKDFGLMANRMRQRSRRSLIQNSLEKIVNQTKRLRTPQKIRVAMEYKWPGCSFNDDPNFSTSRYSLCAKNTLEMIPRHGPSSCGHRSPAPSPRRA